MTKQQEALDAIEEYMVIKRKIDRKQVKRLISTKVYPDEDKKSKRKTSLLSIIWVKLQADPKYSFVRGPSKKTDYFVYADECDKVILHNGIFSCPRCGKKHEIEFKPLAKPNIRGQAWAMCKDSRQPIIMTLS